MSRILIIEDEPHMVSGLTDALTHQGYEVEAAYDGVNGLRRALEGTADLILLDLMLPGIDGLAVCRRLRDEGVATPVLMLTARSEEADVITGLDVGADDYVTKPFSVQELLARMRALLRRGAVARISSNGGKATMGDTAAIGDTVSIGDTAAIGDTVTVHFKRYVLVHDGNEHALTEREVALLRLLLEHGHEVVRRDRVLEEVWGYQSGVTTRTVDTFVYRLRQKIEAVPQRPRHLLTVRGVGYKLVP